MGWCLKCFQRGVQEDSSGGSECEPHRSPVAYGAKDISAAYEQPNEHRSQHLCGNPPSEMSRVKPGATRCVEGCRAVRGIGFLIP